MQREPSARHVQPSTIDISLVLGDTDDCFYNTEKAEEQWLPLMGPTAFLLARRLLRLGKRGLNSFDTELMASNLGVSQTKVVQSTNRLVRFGPAWFDDDLMMLPYHWPEP